MLGAISVLQPVLEGRCSLLKLPLSERVRRRLAVLFARRLTIVQGVSAARNPLVIVASGNAAAPAEQDINSVAVARVPRRSIV
jgi:hypothetical protein